MVIVVFAGGSAIARTLEALRRQEGAEPAEVIVAAEAGAVNQEALRQILPQVRCVSAPAGAHPAELRALGVRAATGRLVACTEDHCVPAPDWCARIVAAHRAEELPLAVGGAIQKLQPDSAIAWAAYLLEYGPFMPPLTSGPARRLSDCNVSYKRAALEAIAEMWTTAFHETSVHAELRRRWGDAALVRDSRIVVLQSRHPRPLPFLAERFAHGRLFARLRSQRLGPFQRVAYGVAALGVAPLMAWRAFNVARRRPDARSAGVRAIPYLAAAATSWALGESVGALTRGREP